MWTIVNYVYTSPQLFLIQILTGFEDNSSFVWPEDGSVVLNLWLRATVKQNSCGPRSQSVTILLCTSIFFQIVLFHWKIKTPSTYVRQVWESHYFLLWYCDVKMTYLYNQWKKCHQIVNNSIAGNRLKNFWPVNRTVMQRIWIFGLHNVVFYCICFI